jgi:hypothetical protein
VPHRAREAPREAHRDAVGTPRSDGPGLALACVGAATALGLTLQVSSGTLHPLAIVGLTGTLVVISIGIGVGRSGRWTRRTETALAVLLGAALALQLAALLSEPPGIYLDLPGGWPDARFQAGLAALAVTAAAVLVGRPAWRRWLVPALLLAHLSLGAWLIQSSPAPVIDVFVFQRLGADALLQGESPYATAYPNIYGHGAFYGEALVDGRRLAVGFPYPPLSLYLSVLGNELGGDPRYAQLVALTGAGALLAFTRGGALGAGAAALLLSTPRGLFVLENAWTEPFLVMGLAATVFCACRRPRALPYALGLLLAVKQHTILLLPLVPLLTLLRGRALWNVLWKAGATAAVVTVPLVLPDVPAFVRSVVTMQIHQPFRADSLSYAAWWVSQGHTEPSVGIAFAAAALATTLALWRAPRTPAGFAAGAALVYAVFFALNKQAFANYYYFVVGALCIAAAAAVPNRERPRERAPGAETSHAHPA